VNWQGGYLDVYGGAPYSGLKWGVFTNDSPNRAGQNTGTWEILSASGKPVGAEVLLVDAIHLKNLYQGFGGYLDTAAHAPAPSKFRVHTCDSLNRDHGSGSWRIHHATGGALPDSKVRVGDPIVLLNGYYNAWTGGYLDSCGNASAPCKYNVYTCDSWNRDSGSGMWRFVKA
jgi:hypothetical protein